MQSRCLLINMLLLLLSCVVLMVNQCDAMKVKLREAPSSEPHLPADWKHWFNVIASLVEEEEFQESLREFLREKGSSPVNYCLITAVTCNENYQIESFNIDGLNGNIDFSKIPQGATSISISRSTISQPLDASKLPFWVKTLKMENVTFQQGAVKFTKRHSTLSTFVCRRCGLTRVEWDTVPALVHLDLSNNALGDFSMEKLPPTLRFLNLSSCGLTIDASALQMLPPPILTLDLGHNKIEGSITQILFPSALEYLDLSYNNLQGQLHVDNFAFTLWEIRLSHNKISGEVGDLTSFLTLKGLDVSYNQLSSVRWDQLAPQLQRLDLRHNLLVGSLDLKLLPSTLVFCDVSSNSLNGPLDMTRLPGLLEHLDVSNNQFSGPLELAKFSENIRFIYLQNNKFTGNPDLTNLPVDVRRILIYGNDWDSLMPPM